MSQMIIVVDALLMHFTINCQNVDRPPASFFFFSIRLLVAKVFFGVRGWLLPIIIDWS